MSRADGFSAWPSARLMASARSCTATASPGLPEATSTLPAARSATLITRDSQPGVFASFARKDTLRPALAGVISILIYLLVAIILLRPMGLLSLMIADGDVGSRRVAAGA